MPKQTITISGRTLTLDARPDRVDLRDLAYRPPVDELPPLHPEDKHVAELLPAYHDAKLILDQGKEGACTGFGLAAVINYLLWRRSRFTMKAAEQVSPRMLYQLARFYDEWPGEDYEGSSCRGALKGWHRHGVCLRSLWPYESKRFVPPKDGWDTDAVGRPLGVYYRVDRTSVVDMQAAIRQTGAVYVSADVHQGWDVEKRVARLTHAALPIITRPKKPQSGGHAFALVGYNDIGFVVQNSWGDKWGALGFAVLPYEDWVENGADAWVVALGAPVKPRTQEMAGGARTPRQVSGAARAFGMRAAGSFGWFGERDALAREEHAWPEARAYEHTLVTGNDGRIVNCLLQVENEAGAAELVCHDKPKQWFEAKGAGAPRRLAIYAHGGLNSQAESIKRIRMMAPYFEQNGIYPVFLTWSSGWLETLGQMLEDGWKAQLGAELAPVRGLGEAIAEARDRTLEVLSRHVLARSLWSEMKENLTRSGDAGRGLDTLGVQLKRLQDESGGELEIHLIGHSAGSFACGRLLDEFKERGLGAASCTLYAPACDLRFALDHYAKAIDRGTLSSAAFRIHLLTDKRERGDEVGPYGKSLLYLVSRALERLHKTPLLGLVNAFGADLAADTDWHSLAVQDVKDWQEFFWGDAAPAHVVQETSDARGGSLVVLDERQVNAGKKRIKASHGCFDNSIEIVGDTLKRILRLGAGQKLPFPMINLAF
jgi:hypothetical protein